MIVHKIERNENIQMSESNAEEFLTHLHVSEKVLKCENWIGKSEWNRLQYDRRIGEE